MVPLHHDLTVHAIHCHYSRVRVHQVLTKELETELLVLLWAHPLGSEYFSITVHEAPPVDLRPKLLLILPQSDTADKGDFQIVLYFPFQVLWNLAGGLHVKRGPTQQPVASCYC